MTETCASFSELERVKFCSVASFFNPLLMVTYPVPKAALMPIIMLWLGVGDVAQTVAQGAHRVAGGGKRGLPGGADGLAVAVKPHLTGRIAGQVSAVGVTQQRTQMQRGDPVGADAAPEVLRRYADHLAEQ